MLGSALLAALVLFGASSAQAATLTVINNADSGPGSSDPDDGDFISLSQDSPGPYPLGQTLVTLTVTDSHGASSHCQAIVTVIDATPPVLTCPPNQIVNATTPTGATVTYPAATAVDNCGQATITYSQKSGTLFAIVFGTVSMLYEVY